MEMQSKDFRQPGTLKSCIARIALVSGRHWAGLGDRPRPRKRESVTKEASVGRKANDRGYESDSSTDNEYYGADAIAIWMVPRLEYVSVAVSPGRTESL